MDALLSIQMANGKRVFHPGDKMTYLFQIDAIAPDEIVAVECSVMWFTEGKGDEDIGVMDFQRFVPTDVEDYDLRPLRQVETILPNSPLSHAGEIVKIRWCVRVRVFPKQGREVCEQVVFRLESR